jgi:hypothetical protein
MALAYLLISVSLHSDGSARYNIKEVEMAYTVSEIGGNFDKNLDWKTSNFCSEREQQVDQDDDKWKYM